MEIIETVKSFMKHYIKKDDLKEEDNIFDQGLISSLFLVQLVSFIEEEYGISIPNEELDMDHFKDINSIASLIKSRM
jgi:methoxymalonate biosynthesis acyl carrier protein